MDLDRKTVVNFSPKILWASGILVLGILFSGCQSETLTNQTDPAPPDTSYTMGTESQDSSGDDSRAFSIDELLAEAPLDEGPSISDPFEGFNRAIFKFNDGFYEGVLEPVSETYTAVMPDPFETGISNFFDNLYYPIRLVSYSLQGNLDLAGLETQRFLVDSTVGLAGVLRPSDDIPRLADLPDSDLGLTFATWGIDHGPYLVLPILGPSSLRDGAGFFGAIFLDPLRYIDESALRMTLVALEILNRSPEILDNYNRGKAAALDPYVSIRDFYIQFRARELEALKNYTLTEDED